MKLKTIFVLTLLLIFACKNSKEERATAGEEYFPLKVGDFKIYEVDSLIHDDFSNKTDTIKTELREQVVEKLIDNENDTIYRIELSSFDSKQLKWVTFLSFFRKIKGIYMIESQNNIKEVKILAPISNYKTRGSSHAWNINMFNQNDPQMVKFNKLFYKYTQNGIVYPECINIQLTRPISGIVNQYREEIYAKNKGLIFKKIDFSEFTKISKIYDPILKDTILVFDKKKGFETTFRLKE